MKYLVKSNLKCNGIHYRAGQVLQSDDPQLITQLVKSDAVEPLALDESPAEGLMEGKDESSSPPPDTIAPGLDSEMGEDLGGYDDDGSYAAKPKKSKKKKG